MGSDGERQKRLWDRRKEKAALFLLDMHFSHLISLKLVCVLEPMASEYWFRLGGSFDVVIARA